MYSGSPDGYGSYLQWLAGEVGNEEPNFPDEKCYYTKCKDCIYAKETIPGVYECSFCERS